ncbi:MAG TPA: hypothetical protein VL281_11790 [Mycobacteriales bacterium]|jgi:hypothetical protein|nr:hypothetical protein [Mycobacteriales bacterium]
MTVPDVNALKRRVLLTGLLSLVLFFATGWAVAALDVAGAWFLIALALEYLLVVRPLMRPVREAVKLRRRLAYQAWLDEKGKDPA